MTELPKSPADVVLIDANWTVRRNVRRLLESAGLSVLAVRSLAEVAAAVPLGAVAVDALVILDVSHDPSVVVELGSRLPAGLRRPDRIIVSTVQPALVDSFCPPDKPRPFAGVLVRPFAPTEIAEVGAAFFPGLTLGSLAAAQPMAPNSDPDWQTLGERLAQSGNGVAHGQEATRVASSSAPHPQQQAPSATPSEPRAAVRGGSSPQPLALGIVRHDAATVVAEAVLVGPRVSPSELETRSIRDLDAVDIDLDDSGEQVVLEEASAALRAVRELRTEDFAVADEAIELYVDDDLEVAVGSVPSAATHDEESEPHTQDGEPADDDALDDADLDLNEHDAPTRDYGPGIFVHRALATPPADEEEIEELPPEFVMAVDDFSDAEPTAVPSDALDSAPPPAPAVPAHIRQALHVEGATRVWPLGDILKHVAVRGLQGAVVITEGEQAFIIFVDGGQVRWAEPLSAEGHLDLASYLLASGVIAEEAFAELKRAAVADREVVDVLVAKSLAVRAPLLEAIAWQVTQHLWQAAAALDGRFRVVVQLEPEHAALAEARPMLQLDTHLVLLELYRRFPECIPLRGQAPGERYVAHGAVVEHYRHTHGLLADEQWVVAALVEPRTIDGLLEMASDQGFTAEQMVGTLARLAEVGMVMPMPRA